ncbi:unnamed protein product [Adineta steineri]|uniref:NAD(P)(+)--arginine ADP-ribosyltransferase n=1 Tax=Adineta steineri TaxID=433720 RepID=A0A818ZZH1_9BILA|nr:unnamed protein product [Adineta steineri]CAF1466586.1 unnamed protein product [Adineta steineri]CAF3574177.1 unnamed protein product [Adineta steineri]CAF3775949.1 unnamed protein product [Adineta steineri]
MLRFTNVDHKPTRLSPIYGYHTYPLLPLRQALEPILQHIDQLDEFIQIAKTECHFPSEHGLTREESAAIYIYTMDWGEQSLYRVLNGLLRIKDRTVLVPWHGYLKLFDDALKKLPSHHINLWRGVNVDISKNFKKGEELTWWNITSSCSLVNVVKQFLGPSSTLFLIEAKNGKLISAYSNFPAENEVILGLGTRVRVVSDALDSSSLNVVHLMELLDENDDELSSPISIMNIDTSKNNQPETSMNLKSSTFKVHIYGDGSRYAGEWKNQKQHGKGIGYYVDGDKYTGDWIDNKRTDQGIFAWANGDRYEGQWKDNNMNGKGIWYYADGSKYTGDWIDDMMTGQGIFTWASGERYEGQWKEDNMSGKGTRYWVNGNTYTGNWVDNEMTGQGIYTWASGDRYEGQWKDSDMNGKGTRYYGNGNTYTGDWIDNKRTGQGIFTWANGDRYEGQWKDSNMNGKGTRYWANENTYTGDWIDNKRTGQGVFAWANGDRYEGQWRDDNMNGRGNIYYANGQVKDGMWSNGVYIG